MKNLLLLLADFRLIRNDASSLDHMRAKLREYSEECQDIVALAESEDRELNDDETGRIDELNAKFDTLKADIDRKQRIIDNSQSLQEPGRPAPRQAPRANSGDGLEGDNFEVQPNARLNGGFRSLGDFGQAVQVASARGGRIDDRLIRNAPTTYGSEGTDADGGYAVPPDFREPIGSLIFGEESLLGKTDVIETSSNSVTMPKDETTAWQTSGGILSAWTGEAAQLAQSKPALLPQIVPCHKLTTLVPVTDELLTDAPALNSYLGRKAPEKINFAINLALISGDGSGKPSGLTDAGSKIAQAKESGQAAATVVFDNVVNMLSRLYSGYANGAVWIANQDILPQLIKMEFPGDSSPVYLPNNNIAGAPFGTLMGKPIIFTEGTEALGTEGDLILTNMSTYMSVVKVGGIRQDVSIHLFFDYDVTAFRFIVRVGGKSWLDNAISPRTGAVTKSNVVTLATRA